MRRVPTILIALILTAPVRGQWFDKSNAYDFASDYHRWGLTLEGGWFPAFGASPPVTGEFRLHRLTALGYGGGLAYNWMWSDRMGLKFRLLATRMPLYKMTIYVPPRESAEGEKWYHRTRAMAPWMIRVPVSFEVRSFKLNRYVLFAHAGGELAYRPAFTRTFREDPHFAAVYSLPAAWQPALEGGLGWYYPSRTGLWEVSFFYRFSFRTAYEGYYALYIYDLPVLDDNPRYKTGDENPFTPARLGFPLPYSGTLYQKGHEAGVRVTLYLKRTRPGDESSRCGGAKSIHSRQVLRRKRMIEKARQKAEQANKRAARKAAKRNRKAKKSK
ncbi:MAG: hypothetical protein GXO27_02230 [Chlorobi bacterium]|nr:hypothetical protein [Chlorobiota bacterium]